MNKEKIFDLLKEYTNGDYEILKDFVSAVNHYDGELEDYYYFYNDSEFYDIMFADKEEVARAVYYASSYCFTDEYIKLNVYGNCETIDDYEYSCLLRDNEDEIIEEYIEGLYKDFGYFISEINNDDLKEEIERYVRCEENE